MCACVCLCVLGSWPSAGAKGDNDPLDAIEIGSKQWRTGSIVRVKILGVLAMIDSGETDWKVVCVNQYDPLAPVRLGCVRVCVCVCACVCEYIDEAA
jgi:hypothetical protein